MEKKKKDAAMFDHMSKNKRKSGFQKSNSHCKGSGVDHSHRTTNK